MSSIASSESHGSEVLEIYFSVYIAPFIVIERELLKNEESYENKNQYTGLQPAICEMLFVFRSISAYWNNRILNSLRDLCFSTYRGPPEQVLFNALREDFKDKKDPDTAVKVLFEWKGDVGDMGFCLDANLSIVVTDQPPRDNRQIAEDLADQIFHYKGKSSSSFRDDYDEESSSPFSDDYRMIEKWISSCEAKSLNPAKQNFEAFVRSQEAKNKEKEEMNKKVKEEEKVEEKEEEDDVVEEDDALVVDEMVIARILRDRSVDYSAPILKNRKDSYGMPLPGLPVVTWRRNQFTRARSTLFGSQWPKLRRRHFNITMQEFILMQGCGVLSFGDDEEARDPRTYQTLKLFICALDANPVQQVAKREWISEQVLS